jgi:putative ABC transport system permease protein
MKVNNQNPPAMFLRFFRWYCHPKMQDYIEGDLMEVYRTRLKTLGKRKADLKFIIDVLLLFRPGIIRPLEGNKNLNNYGMYKSYIKVGLRNLLRNKGYAAINIGGLALGMSVALLIGLWINDELAFNKYHKNYDRIARVMFHSTYNGQHGTTAWMPFPLGPELSKSFQDDFEHIVMSTFPEDHVLSYGDKKFGEQGQFMQVSAPEMLTLNIIMGSRAGLKNINSILLSESCAMALFGEEDPLDKVLEIDNRMDVKVTGVYEDLPKNSQFNEIRFIAPWDLYVTSNGWLNRFLESWNDGMIQVLVQVPPHRDMKTVSQKIKNVIHDHVKDEDKIHQQEAFLQPMSKWHLYEQFENGKNIGGQIQFVWLFGIIGVFVLLLACINFMNLSTARSERRAKEVGIRKAIGSVRGQLINQFFSESILITFLAFTISIAAVVLALPWFNEVANKQMSFPQDSALFWISCIAFTLFTGIVAGSYPALYLSSFLPVAVLKGTFRAGRYAVLPRQVLVVIQFTVSVSLIIGTMIVYQQIQYTKNRPIGYDRTQLVSLRTTTTDIYDHFEAVRNELINSGAIIEMTESSSATTDDYQANFGGFQWKGKDPDLSDVFGVSWVLPEYGKTVGWQFLEGRDFSREISSDQSGMIINESAAKYMGLKNPVGEIVMLEGHPLTILGVVKDMVVGSPYEPTRQAIYMALRWSGNVITLKLNPSIATNESLSKIQTVFNKYAPAMPFEYNFADEEFAKKFSNEVRIGKLTSVFATLAILISALGLFGLASFVAEQRKKEIGIRRIMGASVTSLWGMLSKDFVLLVIVSCAIAAPLTYSIMFAWLQRYVYRTDIPLSVFIIAGVGALVVTLFTVSYQAVRAALANPVKSLRSE